MATFAFALPILQGKEETDRQLFERVQPGQPEREEYLEARRAQGFTRETVWHQKGPDGSLAIVIVEADDVQAAFQRLASSDKQFDARFRDIMRDVHGVDLAQDPPPEVTLISDTRF